MAKMREIKIRINSVKKTKQITKAMKLISVSKMKKARKQYEGALPFYNKVKEIMAKVLKSDDIDNIFFKKHKLKKGEKPKKVYLVLSGDKGLAGGYNNNIIKLVEERVDKEDKMYVAGYYGKNHFSRMGFNVEDDFDYPVQNPTLLRASDIAEMFLTDFKERKLDELYVIYTKVVSGMTFNTEEVKLLPLDKESLIKDVDDLSESEDSFSYEPSVKEVFRILVDKYVKGIIYGLLVESFVSEQTSRMTAMDNATRNADKMIKELELYYNRARQAAITQEITEIIGGTVGESSGY